MNIQDCLKKGFLKKESPSIEKANQSLIIAKSKLKEARKSLESELYESTIVFAYMSMFHAARSLLFKEGYIEKSHIGLVIFLEEKYSSILGKGVIYEFNTVRMSRHESLYGLDSNFNEEDAKHILNIANKFLTKIENIKK